MKKCRTRLNHGPYTSSDLTLLDDIRPRWRDERHYTEAEVERLDELLQIIQVKQRVVPPPPEEADQWERGVYEVERGGAIVERIAVWYPKAESDEYWRLRFGLP